ncbi:hypothetical protein DER46DRAFT_611774 [Fusarium sp. MPI-SDFR-AT-0072]|nr:hypothetical protein DER46DRAFT_611774 [Fusarium sp. MPI-SDFR-AT-0072]
MMKLSLFLVAGAFAGIMAAPSEQSTALEARDVEARASCWNRSGCSRNWSGNCEDYCKPYKFSHMAKTDCGLFAKRCCCKT